MADPKRSNLVVVPLAPPATDKAATEQKVRWTGLKADSDYEAAVNAAINTDEAGQIARFILIGLDMFVEYFESRDLAVNITISRCSTPEKPTDKIVAVNFDWVYRQQ
jgi:hypothetical protein